MDSPSASGNGDLDFDPAKPFAHVVLCCTSIQPDQRTDIAQRTTDLGGIHKYDLTPDITHLVVGEYDTPKYRHVARERPDVKPMAAGWVHAVRDLWMEDKEIDFARLEAEWTLKPFETGGGNPLSPHKEDQRRRGLVCCLTGFEDQDERDRIENAVKANGAEFTGDLSRKVTHLIVCKPEGNKYRAARDWNIITVSVEWLDQSIERGMILDETCYDPLIPPDQRGKGATKDMKRASLGKRPRDATTAAPDEGRRKLRKSASMKFNAGGDSIWNEMVVKKSATDLSARPPAMDQRSESMPVVAESYRSFGSANHPPPPPSESTAGPTQPPEGGVFSSCRFFVHGFPPTRTKIVCEHLVSHGAEVSPSLADAAASTHPEPADQRFLVVPQASQPETHPLLPEGIHIVTEFYLERCIHNKSLFHPTDHVLGRPFPHFPIDGFQDLVICTAGFKNEQLNQLEKTVSQLGAKYAEKLNSQSSLLVCPSLQGVRKQKLDFAILSKVPVVHADWLWQCISAGFFTPWDKYLFPEVKQRLAIDVDPDLARQKQKMQRSRSEPMAKKQPPHVRAPVHRTKPVSSGFQDDNPLPPVRESSGVSRSNTEVSQYETAASHVDEGDAEGGGPLAEVNANTVNKSPPTTNQPPREPLKRRPTGGTVADSDGDDSDVLDSSHTPPPAEDPEAARQRETDAKTAAERQAMASRLNSLLPGGGGANSGSGAAADHASRRKRAIYGRAVSNASAGSSASGESAATDSTEAAAAAAAAAAQYKAAQAGGGGPRVDAVSSLEGILRGAGGSQASAHPDDDDDGNNDGNTSVLPVATQVDYDDPEARRHRAAVLDRMLRNKRGLPAATATATAAAAAADVRWTQEQRMTLEKLQEEHRAGGSATPSGGVRKSRRR